MASKSVDFGGTQQSERIGSHASDVIAWAAIDKGNNKVYSHLEIYHHRDQFSGSIRYDLTAEQMIQLAGALMRVAAYRHQLEAQLMPPCDGCGTARDSDDSEVCQHCHKPYAQAVAVSDQAAPGDDAVNAPVCGNCGAVAPSDAYKNCPRCALPYSWPKIGSKPAETREAPAATGVP